MHSHTILCFLRSIFLSLYVQFVTFFASITLQGGGGKKVQETTGETKQLRRIGQKDHKDSNVCVTQDIVDHNSLILSDNTSRALDGNQILSVNTSRELLILLRVVREAAVREVRPRRSQGQASALCLPNCIIIATIITCSNYFAYDLIIMHDKVSRWY